MARASRAAQEALIAEIEAEGARRGFNSTAINSILGNVYGESGFNPHAINPKSKAYGGFQYLGARLNELARQNNVKVADLKAGKAKIGVKEQVKFAFDEMEGKVPTKISGLKKGFKERLNSAKTVTLGTNMFAKEFERPSAKELKGSIGKRVKAANDPRAMINGVEIPTPQSKPTQTLAEVAKNPDLASSVLTSISDIVSGVPEQQQSGFQSLADLGLDTEFASVLDNFGASFDSAQTVAAQKRDQQAAPGFNDPGYVAPTREDIAGMTPVVQTPAMQSSLPALSELGGRPNDRVGFAFDQVNAVNSPQTNLASALAGLVGGLGAGARGVTAGSAAAAAPSTLAGQPAGIRDVTPTRGPLGLSDIVGGALATYDARNGTRSAPEANGRIEGAFSAFNDFDPTSNLAAMAANLASPANQSAVAQTAPQAQAARGVPDLTGMLDPGLMGFQTSFSPMAVNAPAVAAPTSTAAVAAKNQQRMQQEEVGLSRIQKADRVPQQGLTGLRTGQQQQQQQQQQSGTNRQDANEEESGFLGMDGFNAGGVIGALVGGAVAGPIGAVALGYLGNSIGNAFSGDGEGGLGDAIGGFFGGIGDALGGLFGGGGGAVSGGQGNLSAAGLTEARGNAASRGGDR